MARSTLEYRRGSGSKHPPYGLYIDTPHNEYDWIVVSIRVLMVLTLVLAVLLVVVAFGPLTLA